jgi:TonB family protein
MRLFRVPDPVRPVQPLPAQPQVTLAIPDPPILRSPDVVPPEPPATFLEHPAAFPELPAPPVRRVVAPTGAFDATIPPDHAKTRTEISTGTFGDASATTAGSHSKRASDAALSSAAEILVKPRPAYTEEARRLGIEGEVLLEVLFQATGEARVLRTIRGLGHGLDENAIAAARAIQFRAAKRGDAAVDSTAVVHIVFQLAY